MTTDRDYASKDWLRDDGFQLLEPQTAGAIVFFCLALLLVLERVGVL